MLYIEDILVDVMEQHYYKVNLSVQDSLILSSFYNIHTRGDFLTKSQGSLLVKVLKKYVIQFSLLGVDYTDSLNSPEWKSKFRSLDLTKRASVVKEDTGSFWVYLKFPFQLKKDFELEYESVYHLNNYWDHNKKVRKIALYDSNIIHLSEFLIKHQFILDESFTDTLCTIDEIMNQQESIIPRSTIVNGEVKLLNASPDVEEWWVQHSSKEITNDLLLAKSMGYFLDKIPSTTIEKIASSKRNSFWMQSNLEFLKIAHKINGRTVIILDRASRSKTWLKEFTANAEAAGFTPDEIKVCFREDKTAETDLNQWIKEKGYGGKVDTGKLLIFNHKPAKWIFKDTKNIKLLATNSMYLPIDTITRAWMDSHPCVIYLGSTKPTDASKDKKIVKL